MLVSKSTASEAMKVNADHLSDEYNNRKLDNVIEGIEIHKSPSYYWVGDKILRTFRLSAADTSATALPETLFTCRI